ncbi:MAG: hypothetical protein HY925_16900 [Elusimicrobia bacterium]|nr:hypothetical protein [Elusimicrobiota bacterium]
MKRFVFVLTALAFATSAWGADRGALRLVRNTGHVIVTVGNESWLGDTDAGLPAVIPPGAEVYVLSGRATLRGCGVVVRATEGDDFAYNTFAEQECARAMQLSARGELTAIDVEIGEVETMLSDGEAISVVELPGGKREVRVLAGYVAFKGPTEDLYLGPGGMLVAGPKPVRRLEPEPVAFAPAPGETLRSAPGPKPVSPEPPLSGSLLPVLAVSFAAALALELYLHRRRRRS